MGTSKKACKSSKIKGKVTETREEDVPKQNEGSASDTTATTMSDDRKTRGPTEMYKIQVKKRKGKKLLVQYNSKGVAVGEIGRQFASYIGVMARTIVPINNATWPNVNADLKKKIWTEVTVCDAFCHILYCKCLFFILKMNHL